MVKKLAVTLALCLCAGAFVVAGVSTPAGSVNADDAAFCPFEVEEDGQVKIINGRCKKDELNLCASPGGSCGLNGKGTCQNVPTNPHKKNSKLTCKCVG